MLASGHGGGDGPSGRRCEAMLEALLGGGRVLLTTSGSHALELCALLLDLGPGDEVLVPASSFPSTAGGRTRAVVPVHYGGVGCEMEAIAATAARRGLAVVEDNALGLGGSRHGRALGSLGALAALSFHETRAASCGVGGALVVNDSALVARAAVLLAQLAAGRPGDCPVAESVCDRLLRLPLHAELGDAGVERVVEALTAAW